jgi:hypothetical protein
MRCLAPLNFDLKVLATKADGVGMSNTTRHIPHRRPPVSAQRAAAPMGQVSANSPSRVDTLRRLVAAGQYHVSPKYLAMKIFRASGLDE